MTSHNRQETQQPGFATTSEGITDPEALRTSQNYIKTEKGDENYQQSQGVPDPTGELRKSAGPGSSAPITQTSSGEQIFSSEFGPAETVSRTGEEFVVSAEGNADASGELRQSKGYIKTGTADVPYTTD
eukprot:TRINITY_DN1192_c0_g1_i1.p1 TRINITY_DN1192_c0_g1~~TRINITY_DN1192_c0_g1_i1.p1  ORF type:complete len:129 (+),score=13.14 TRINITY_DN1192_c0_g1_i1:125-511(+)